MRKKNTEQAGAPGVSLQPVVRCLCGLTSVMLVVIGTVTTWNEPDAISLSVMLLVAPVSLCLLSYATKTPNADISDRR